MLPVKMLCYKLLSQHVFLSVFQLNQYSFPSEEHFCSQNNKCGTLKEQLLDSKNMPTQFQQRIHTNFKNKSLFLKIYIVQKIYKCSYGRTNMILLVMGFTIHESLSNFCHTICCYFCFIDMRFELLMATPYMSNLAQPSKTLFQVICQTSYLYYSNYEVFEFSRCHKSIGHIFN